MNSYIIVKKQKTIDLWQFVQQAYLLRFKIFTLCLKTTKKSISEKAYHLEKENLFIYFVFNSK